MVSYAFILKEGFKDCKQCGRDHYYLTNNHIVITGSKEELENVGFPFETEIHDPTKSDIKRAQNIFGMWPSLDTNRDGIIRNVGSIMPAMCYGYWRRNIKLSYDKTSILVRYSKDT